MKTFQDLLNDPPSAVTFGPQGFKISEYAWCVLSVHAWKLTRERNYPNSYEFERAYDFVEHTLVELLETAVRKYANDALGNPVEQTVQSYSLGCH